MAKKKKRDGLLVYDEMQTCKDIYKHTETGEIYLQKRTWHGDLISSAGPLKKPLKDADEYELSVHRNDWILEQGDKLERGRVSDGFFRPWGIRVNTKYNALPIADKEKKRIRLRTKELLEEGFPGIVKALDEWIYEPGQEARKEFERILEQDRKGLKLSERDKEYKRNCIQAAWKIEDFYKHTPDAKFWRLNLFVKPIDKLYIALRLKNLPHAAEDIKKKFLQILKALAPNLQDDVNNPPRPNPRLITKQEMKNWLAELKWQSTAPPSTMEQVQKEIRFLKTASNKIFEQKLKDFRDMIAGAIKVLQSKGQPEAATGKTKADLSKDAVKKKAKKPFLPRGYIGSQDIINSTVGELKGRLRLPVKENEEYKIPRSTLGYWQTSDNVSGGTLEGDIKYDPITREVWYPKKWLKTRLKAYKPSSSKP